MGRPLWAHVLECLDLSWGKCLATGVTSSDLGFEVPKTLNYSQYSHSYSLILSLSLSAFRLEDHSVSSCVIMVVADPAAASPSRILPL